MNKCINKNEIILPNDLITGIIKIFDLHDTGLINKK
jgi:hypothetical protein